MMNDMCTCKLCGGQQFDILFVKDKFYYAKCKDCNLVFVQNPHLGGLADHYDEYAKEYLTSRLQQDFAIDYSREFHKLERCLGKKSDNKSMRLLDVGCSTGAFLSAAKHRGYWVAGAELAENSASFARNQLNTYVYSGDFLKMPLPDELFDVITARQVLEHLPDPNLALQKMYSLLKQGGGVFVAVPNYNSLARFIKRKNHWVFSGDHLFYFTKHTLTNFLKKNGFEAIDDETPIGANYASKSSKILMNIASPLIKPLGLGGVLEILAIKK